MTVKKGGNDSISSYFDTTNLGNTTSYKSNFNTNMINAALNSFNGSQFSLARQTAGNIDISKYTTNLNDINYSKPYVAYSETNNIRNIVNSGNSQSQFALQKGGNMLINNILKNNYKKFKGGRWLPRIFNDVHNVNYNGNNNMPLLNTNNKDGLMTSSFNYSDIGNDKIFNYSGKILPEMTTVL